MSFSLSLTHIHKHTHTLWRIIRCTNVCLEKQMFGASSLLILRFYLTGQLIKTQQQWEIRTLLSRPSFFVEQEERTEPLEPPPMSLSQWESWNNSVAPGVMFPGSHDELLINGMWLWGNWNSSDVFVEALILNTHPLTNCMILNSLFLQSEVSFTVK